MSNPWSRLILVPLLLCIAFPSPEAAAADGWRKLPLITRGRLDRNWVHIGHGGWVVEDGTLKTQPAAKGLGLLVFKKERFGNCQIRLVFKTKEISSNSGLYIRMNDGVLKQIRSPGAAYVHDKKGAITPESMERMKASALRDEGPWYGVHHGYEIQISSFLGDPKTSSNGTGAIYSLAQSTAVHTDTRQWTTMIITLDRDRIDVDVNDKRASSFDTAKDTAPPQEIWFQPKREPKRPQVGYIGLQTHDPDDIVWFKEISVRPLPQSPTH